MGRSRLEEIEQAEKVVGVAVGRLGNRRSSESAHIVANGAKFPLQRRPLSIPHGGIEAETMDEDHGMTGACGAIAQPSAVRADEGHVLHSARIAAGNRRL